MSAALTGHDEALVLDVLEQRAMEIERRGRGAWRATLANGTLHAATIRVQDGWLTLDVDPNGAPFDPWSVLGANHAAPPGLKRCITTPTEGPRLRAELSTEADDPDCLRARIVALLEAVEDGCATGGPGASIPAGGDGDDPPRLAELCADAGWPGTARDGGRVAVRLDVMDGPAVAMLHRRDDGSIAAELDLVDGGAAPDDPCREALARMLLLATGATRLVSPAVETLAPDQVVTRLETRLPADPRHDDIDRALSALTVAAAHCGAEATVLHEDHRVAAAFLRGWPAVSAAPYRTTITTT